MFRRTIAVAYGTASPLLAVLLAAANAEAGLINTGGKNEPCYVDAFYDWDGGADEENIPPPGPNAWTGTVKTEDDFEKITARIRHSPGEPVCPENPPLHGENATPLGFSFEEVGEEPPVKEATVLKLTAGGQVSHGDHFDYGKMSLEVQLPAAEKKSAKVLVAVGHHDNLKKFLQVSFRVPKDVRASVTVVPDYRRIGDDGTIEIVQDEIQRETKSLDGRGEEKGDHEPFGPFDPELSDGSKFASFIMGAQVIVPPKQEEIRAETEEAGIDPVSGRTETHLAFLGTVNGVFTELDLAPMAELFVGLEEFLVPFLRPLEDDTLDLFVGVDLTQWLGQEAIFEIGDIFSVTDGTSFLLPGFVVGLSPVYLSASGFTSDNLFTGDLIAQATIDGQVVDEPQTLLLLGLGLAILCLFVYRRKEFRSRRFIGTSRQTKPGTAADEI